MSFALTRPTYPEPIPSATQLASLPFLAAIEGHLRRVEPRASVRVTLHRAMSRNGGGYLQQVAAYVGTLPYDQSAAGRIFPVTQGIMGRSYKEKKIIRTKKYKNEIAFLKDLKADMQITGDTNSIEDIAKSYIAIPFLAANSEVAAILYSEASEFNLFSDDDLVQDLIAQCDGFCRVIDAIIVSPLPGIRNYQLEQGEPVIDAETVYPKIQEVFSLREIPGFENLRSFHFEFTG